MKKRFLLYLSILSAFTACTTADCKLTEVRTLHIENHWHPGTAPAYTHYVLVKGFAKSCMDSTAMVNIAAKYADTVSLGKTADIIRFYGSDEIFKTDGKPSPVDLNKYCLVQITFDNKKPALFTYYNDNGSVKHLGSKFSAAKYADK